MGRRGEGWVVGQFVIGAGILAAPFLFRNPMPLWAMVIGGALMALGGLIAGMGILTLGSNLTPFPKPKEEGHFLVTTGPYRYVRHPIYSGILFGALGWSILWGSLPAVALTIALFVWFDFKSRREEAWLVERHPIYAEYQKRAKKLIPFIY